MAENHAREIVDRYFDALTTKDQVVLRSLLHDDLAFKGPLATLDNADAFVQGIGHVTANMIGLERRVVFEDGGDICQIYNFVFATPAVTVLPVAEWLQVRDNRIASIQMFHDPRPLIGQPAS